MKRNLFFYLLLCSLCFIALSCNDNETLNYSPDIEGTYKGELKSFVENDKQEYSTSTQIELNSNSENTVNLNINNLSILTDDGYIHLGNIAMNNIPVTPSTGENVHLGSLKQDFPDLGPFDAVTVEITGTVNPANSDVYVTINIGKTDVGNIKLVFNSNTVSKSEKYDFENWASITYKYGSTTVDCKEVNGFSSSNKGIAFIHASIENFNKIPVTRSADSKNDTYAAKIETFDTHGNNLIPYITAGSLFFGSYEMGGTIPSDNIQLGIPYNKEPEKFKGWYKYTPGTDYYESKTGKMYEATINSKMKDSCLIIAVLYEVADTENEFIALADLFTSDKIVMKAELANGGQKNQWTEFNLDFKTISGKTYNSSKKYKLAIISSSSRNGYKYCGSPGSALFVDDFEITFK